MKRLAGSALGAAVALCAASASAQAFSYLPAGDLVSGSGTGRKDDKVYAPGMRFPIEVAPAFANSQVYMNGGMYGPGGSQCDKVNYSYPWRDNYCEKRTWDMPLCPAGQGHQGQDIRPATCKDKQYFCVAAADGTITNIGTYSVYLTAADGTRYDYLHMGDVSVSVGAKVKKGDRIGKVSNQYDGTPTTIHLHFNIRQAVSGVGTVYVPPYMSLVTSYQALIGPVNEPPKGTLESVSCSQIKGWSQDPDTPAKAVEVRLSFDGPAGDAGAQTVSVVASENRPELCQQLGSCDHGFLLDSPLGLMDGKAHPVSAFGVDTGGGPGALLGGSPKSLDCAPPKIPDGVRRKVAGTASFGAWKFSALLDVLAVSDAALGAIAEWDALPASPVLAKSTDGSAQVWLVDGAFKRPVPSTTVAAAWRFDLGKAEAWAPAKLAGYATGTPVRPRPFLIQGTGAVRFLVDDKQVPGGSDAGAESGTAWDAGSAGSAGGASWSDGAAAAAGAAGPAPVGGGPGDAAAMDETQGGCSCSSASRHATSAGWVLGAGLWALLLTRRSRRRRGSARLDRR
jgi:hypothetical protein